MSATRAVQDVDSAWIMYCKPVVKRRDASIGIVITARSRCLSEECDVCDPPIKGPHPHTHTNTLTKAGSAQTTVNIQQDGLNSWRTCQVLVTKCTTCADIFMSRLMFSHMCVKEGAHWLENKMYLHPQIHRRSMGSNHCPSGCGQPMRAGGEKGNEMKEIHKIKTMKVESRPCFLWL